MKIPRPLLVALIALIAAGIWYFGFRSTKEDIILQKLDELAETVSNAPGEGLLGKAKVISAFQDLFSDPVVLETRYRAAQGVRSPKELAAGYLALIQSGQSVTLSFRSTSVDFPRENEARVKTTVEGSLSRNGQAEQNQSETLYITLGKDQNGNWKFERFSERP